MLLAGLAIVVIAAAGLAVFFRGDLLRPAPVVPDKPSIVVLPFSNLGNDPAQVYFSDGITADITTSLSKLSGLFVIASSSAQNYRNPPTDIKQLAETLGVRYVLEGNVRRSGNRLRVNAQLIDANTGFQLWAERYDRDMKDVLDVQDDVTAKIVNALSVELTEAERQRSARRYTVNIEAYDEFLRGQFLYVRGTPEDNLQARALFQQAIDRDPGFARAYGAMALTYVDEFRFGWGKNPAAALERALELANRAVALDDQLPQAYRALSYAYLHRREYQNSIDAIQRAIALDPNDADGRASLALSHVYDGKLRNRDPDAARGDADEPALPGTLRLRARACLLFSRPARGRRHHAAGCDRTQCQPAVVACLLYRRAESPRKKRRGRLGGDPGTFAVAEFRRGKRFRNVPDQRSGETTRLDRRPETRRALMASDADSRQPFFFFARSAFKVLTMLSASS